MENLKKIHALVNLDKDENVICFCPYEDYLRGLCECRKVHNCPEALIEITILPESRPSDRDTQEIKKFAKRTKQAEKDMREVSHRIKQGVGRLEKAIRGSRWKI